MIMKKVVLLSLLAAVVCLGRTFNAVLRDSTGRDTRAPTGARNARHLSTVWPRTGPVLTAYCTVAMCAPFRQELYSGRSPWRTGTLPNHSEIGGWHQECGSLPETSWLSGCSARKISRRSERMLSLRAAQASLRSMPAETLTKGPSMTAKIGQSFCLFISSHDSTHPSPQRYLRLRCKIDRPPTGWIPQLREEMVKYYAEIANFDN